MRLLRAGVLASALLVLFAAPAFAHVTLHSTDAAQGATNAVIAIRVPDEEDAATTVGLEVDFPAATPLIGLSVEPTPGWRFQVTRSNLLKPIVTNDGTITQYVSRVVWSGGPIPAGGYQDFNVDVGLMPAASSIEVKALQTYSNGDIVRWIDETGPNGQIPDHPAPRLSLLPASHGSSKQDNTLAIVAIVIAAGALVVTVVRRR
jgi:uncharacterized protein YcnI